MTTPVADLGSNASENIHYAATIIGKSSVKRQVFDAVYTGKQRVKAAREIASRTGLPEKQVLTAGKTLASNRLVNQTKKDGRVAYQKIDFFHHHKTKILSLAGSKDKLAKYPTKRNPALRNAMRVPVALLPKRARVKVIDLDDIESFRRAWKVDADVEIPKSVSETRFRTGIQRIVGELGRFKDWGGETSDLWTTRLKLEGKRRSAAFAFKGPGTSGKLTPGKMGKNGDQLQRLFETPARVFLVQYHGQIDPSVSKQIESLAVAKSLFVGSLVWYGVIDGKDSNRIYKAYRKQF